MSTSLTKDLTKSVKAAARLRSVLVTVTAYVRDLLHQTDGNLEDIILKCKVDKAIPEALDLLVASTKQRL